MSASMVTLPFSSLEHEQLVKHTALAQQLCDFFQNRLQDQQIWNDSSVVRSVSTGCQIVEAFYNLDLPAFESTLEPALKWLRGVPSARELSADEARAARLFPSRFKTFALLRDFEDAGLKRDFQELATHFDSAQGMIINLPSGMHPELATLIWVDTLRYLERDGWSISRYNARMQHALKGIRRAFDEWLADKSNKNGLRNLHRIHFHDDGDASYAFEILVHQGAFDRRPAARKRAREKLVNIVRRAKTVDARNHAPLYCAIQLATHFPDENAHAVVREWLRRLNEWFDEHWSTALPLDLAALTLRLLALTYGDALRAQMFQDNWKYRQENERRAKHAAEHQQEQELEQILRSTFKIKVGTRETLSGRRSQNKVLRVRFGFRTDATTDTGDHVSQDPSALRLIIKQGSVESLRHAIQSYNNLDHELRHYFARHSSSISPLNSEPDAPWYLLMEDLGNTKPLSELLTKLDEPHFGDGREDQAALAAQSVAEAFQALHRTSQRLNLNATTNHVDRLYILPITASIDYLCEPSHFPMLKPFVDDAFEANEINHRRLTAYLTALRPYETKMLRPPFLTQVHGDAHSRNIMLDADMREAKFVDVETMGGGQDYLMDYALLIEDVAFYRTFLIDEEDKRRRAGDWKIRVAGDLSGETRNSVQYPFFPQSSEAAIVFQREILRQIKHFAERMGDETWQPRLWLAIAKSLIMLLDRQTQSKRLSAQRALDVEQVIVGYAEAVRLLNELVTVLEGRGRIALPELPFSSKRVILRDREMPELIKQVKDVFAQLPNVTLKNNPEASAWLDYYTPSALKPFAQFRTSSKQGDVAVLFFAPLQSLSDPTRLLADSNNGAPRVLLNKIGLQSTDQLRDLIYSAYRWSLKAMPG